MTYRELEKKMRKAGNNLADTAIGSMMLIQEEETGTQQDWGDEAPEWIVKNCLGTNDLS